MKKIIALCAMAMLVTVPLTARAATFATGDQYSRGPQDRVSDDLYVAGGSISISSEVAGDVTVAGGTINIFGPVGGSIRGAGGQIMVGDRVAGDLVAAGGTINILPSATVLGDVYVAAGQVTIDGEVRGAVHVRGGRLTINGVVVGNVTANTKTAPVIGQGSRIGGTIVFHPSQLQLEKNESRAPQKVLLALIAMFTAVKMIAYLGATVVAVWWWRRPMARLFQRTYDTFWPSVGRGFVYIILVPVAVVLLMVSFVGLIPGGLALLLYAGLIILAKLLAGMYFGAWFQAVATKKQAIDITWRNAIIGVIAIQLLAFIPVIGWLVQLGIFLAVFGALAGATQESIV